MVHAHPTRHPIGRRAETVGLPKLRTGDHEYSQNRCPWTGTAMLQNQTMNLKRIVLCLSIPLMKS